MSEFGIKIKNIEASTLYEYNNGVRDHYEYKDAMFTNSLFSDNSPSLTSKMPLLYLVKW